MTFYALITLSTRVMAWQARYWGRKGGVKTNKHASSTGRGKVSDSFPEVCSYKEPSGVGRLTNTPNVSQE